jgi:CheY-like chemotaxis protein
VRQSQLLPALLVVDDTPSLPKLLIHTLRSLVPYEVIAVPDATAAFAVLAAWPVPLLITDYHLSDMRSDELAAAAKATSPLTKVMLITADVDRFLIKPFPMRDLVAAVSALLPSNAAAR